MVKPEEGHSLTARQARAAWLRSGAFLVLVAFFLYRYFSLGSPAYLTLGFLLLLLAVLSISGRLPVRWQSLALSIGVSLVFLDLVFYQIDFRGMMAALGQVNYLFLIPATTLLVLSSLVRAWRWGWLLRSEGHIPFISLLSALSIGVAANMVLPARAGEFVRAFVLGRRERLSKTTVFATVVLERVFDGLTILFFLLVVILLIGVSSPELRYMGLAGATFYLTMIAVLALLYFKIDLLEQLVRKVLPESIRQQVLVLMRSFVEGLEVIRDVRQLAVVAALSLLVWVLIAASFWPVLNAFNFGAPVPYYTPFLLVATLGLGLMLPAAPAGIGVFQYVCVLTLRIVFAPQSAALAPDFYEQAAAFSLVLHLAQAVPEILMGLIFFLWEGLTLQDVRSEP